MIGRSKRWELVYVRKDGREPIRATFFSLEDAEHARATMNALLSGTAGPPARLATDGTLFGMPIPEPLEDILRVEVRAVDIS